MRLGSAAVRRMEQRRPVRPLRGVHSHDGTWISRAPAAAEIFWRGDQSGAQAHSGQSIATDEQVPVPSGVSGDEAEMVVLSEEEFAAIRAEEGARILCRDGMFWHSTRVGFCRFCQPIHILRRVRASQVSRPSPLCWGYRVALAEEDRDQANAAIPVYLLADVGDFSRGLSRNRKGDLRKCRRLVEFRELRDPSLLLDQGHRVFESAAERTGCWKPVAEATYRRRAHRSFMRDRTQIVAGLIDGNLAGYLVACAVDGILYLRHLFVSSDACRTGIGTGLYVATIEKALRSGAVREVCNSFHTPEAPTLCRYKESLGFVVVHVPARLVMPSPVLALVRALRPATYYCLTGDLPESLGQPTAQ